MDNPFQSPAVLSFCPGLLGLERGLEQAIGKIRVAAYVEIEAFVIANLIAGMESGVLDPAPIWTDAKTFDARPFHSKIHGIIGGYPCPGESLAGLREGHLYKGFIWPSIRRAIQETRPVWCYFENVDDHLSGTFPIVQRSLRNLGYAVEAGVYTAEEAGAPHERKRLFILALAEPYKLAARGRYSDIFEKGKADEDQTRSENGQRGGDGISISGTELANTESRKSGKQKSGNRGKGIRRRSKELESAADQGICEPKGGQQSDAAISTEKLSHPISTGQPQLGDNGKSPEKGNGRISNPSSELGDTGVIGLQRHIDGTGGVEKKDGANQRSETNGTNTANRYPAGQGNFQYDWEEKRTIEPGLVCTIDGYNFREDLLRAIGNSVVADCAEIAFIDLLKKHLK